jgi:histidyl-tRNA synthetase
MLIDKFAKLTDKELKKQFYELGIAEAKYLELKELLSSDFKALECKLDQYTLNSTAIEGLAEIKELYSFMDGTTAVEYMQFAPYLARGIDIYTGTVWEVFLKNGLIGSDNNQVDFRNTSIGGGGRYDKIITGFVDDGKEYPAVGMTFGLDVIYEVLTRIDNSNARSFVDLFVIPMGTEKESFAFVSSLRSLGINVEIEKNKRKVKKSMDYANKTAIPFTCVIGSNEVEQQLINIKNMNTGEQQQFSLTDYMSIAKHVH